MGEVSRESSGDFAFDVVGITFLRAEGLPLVPSNTELVREFLEGPLAAAAVPPCFGICVAGEDAGITEVVDDNVACEDPRVERIVGQSGSKTSVLPQLGGLTRCTCVETGCEPGLPAIG